MNGTRMIDINIKGVLYAAALPIFKKRIRAFY
jgi:NADP-dependent 3-hydroxy acid dehydrogenase YdfG